MILSAHRRARWIVGCHGDAAVELEDFAGVRAIAAHADKDQPAHRGFPRF